MPSAEKLLERMRNTNNTCTPSELEKVYSAYGFEKRQGGNHTIYRHPDFPQLHATVGRHPSLKTAYAKAAVEKIDQLIDLQQAQRDANG